MERIDTQYQVTVWFNDGTSAVTAEHLTRQDAWGLVMRLCKRGYQASVTTPGTTERGRTDAAGELVEG